MNAENKQHSNVRTTLAEVHVEDFLSLPLIREFVFRSPRDAKTNKEVVDFFVTSDRLNLLISQKCQENPGSRDSTKTIRWVRKKAEDAASQLHGALRTCKKKEIFCDHSRRGIVDFPQGLPNIDHAIAVMEVLHQHIQLEETRSCALPLEDQGTPVHYFSLSDFMNLTNELRTLPELCTYLTARTALSKELRYSIGFEDSLFKCYLLKDGTFEGCNSFDDVRSFIAANELRLIQLLQEKSESDFHASLLESVAEELATRDANLPNDLISRYEPIETRVGYLRMQAVLGNLLFRDRSTLGRRFLELINSVEKRGTGYTFSANSVTSAPDLVFVFGASRKQERKVIVDSLELITMSAMAYLQKKSGFMVVDRDGQGYEVLYINSPEAPTDERLVDFGRKNFGKITTFPMTLIG